MEGSNVVFKVSLIVKGSIAVIVVAFIWSFTYMRTVMNLT